MELRPNRDVATDVSRGANGHAVQDVLIVDDHPLICHALSVTLGHAFGLRKVRTATSIATALANIAAEGPPDAVVLDLNLPDVAGVEGVIVLRQHIGDAPLTVISAELDPGRVTAVLAAGARGYVTKCLARNRMVDAFERMWSGEVVTPEGYEQAGRSDADELAALARDFATLTPQQMNILRLICQGRPNKLISYELSIAEATVKTHIAAIMTKINVRNRTQAALLASKAHIFMR